MPTIDPEFLKRLLATFRLEAEEHISVLSSGLVELEGSSSPERRKEVIETIFREAHSLKGAARSVNLNKIESVCQSLETTFAKIKSGAEALSPELFDRLHHLVSAAAAAISENGSSRPTKTEKVPAAQVDSAQPEHTASTTHERPGLGDNIRVSTAKLGTILLQSEELNLSKATFAHFSSELREIENSVSAWDRECRRARQGLKELGRNGKKNGAANGKTTEPEAAASFASFLDQNERTVKSVASHLSTFNKAFENDRRSLERQTNDLLDNVKRLTMLPFSSLLEVFPKLVRDLCRDCQKDAEFTIRGGNVEAERRILDEIKDPLIHLIRNSIDHGIEHPTERQRLGKSPRANITIEIHPKSGDRVEIVITDDGAGIDLQKVRAAAILKQDLTEEEANKLDDRQTAALIFQSGLSTRREITEVSGRGLGLAIVRDKVARLGGEVTVETKSGSGTTFRLILPLTLARFRGVLVQAADQVFAIPSMQVQRALRLEHASIKSVENRPVAELDGRTVSVVWLAEVLATSAPQADIPGTYKWPGLLLEWANQRIVFLVDKVLQDQEVLVKNLGKQFVPFRNISGAAVLETGQVVPVLNVADLMRSATDNSSATPVRKSISKAKSILVAEDSFTSRTLLKGILESSGYTVTTAVDGAEALQLLETQSFDLLVSDVEMPRMTGLDLTAKIRANRKLAELPVVLVTALDSKEDRERGANVGANAYIVKTSFEQSNLLEAVQRLI